MSHKLATILEPRAQGSHKDKPEAFEGRMTAPAYISHGLSYMRAQNVNKEHSERWTLRSRRQALLTADGIEMESRTENRIEVCDTCGPTPQGEYDH